MNFLARVNPRYLAGISCFAAKNDIRYYLNGVCLDPHPEGGVVLVATNGHVLAAIHDPEGFAENRVIIETPTGDWMKALKLKTYMKDFKPEACWIAERCAVVTYKEPEDGRQPELFGKNVIATAKSQLIDGIFPDYLKVIPADDGEDSGMPWFQADVLQPFIDAAKILKPINSAKPIHIRTRGARSSAVVRFEGFGGELVQRFIGVAMPMNGEDFGVDAMRPDWVNGMTAKQPGDLVDSAAQQGDQA